MRVSIRQLEHADEAREIHALAFSDDLWVGDDHTFWVLTAKAGIVGFCSAIYRPDGYEGPYVFLSRAAVVVSARGNGLQRRMINTRAAWASSMEAGQCITYTAAKNYASMTNLIQCGFKFYLPKDPWVGKTMHYFKRVL